MDNTTWTKPGLWRELDALGEDMVKERRGFDSDRKKHLAPMAGSLLGQPSPAHRLAAVILTRPTSTVLPPALTISCRAVASLARTRPASVRRVQPRASMSASVAPHGFFFQAEDGIRDWSVTGVQTCALPI